MENVVESLWESSFVCEPEIRVTACLLGLFDSNTTKGDYSVMLFKFFDIGGEASVKGSLSSTPSNSFILCTC